MNRRIKRLLACVGMAVVLICGMNPETNIQAANQIKLNKTSANVLEGKSLRLSISGTDSRIKWSSSKKSVAKVDSSGKVTAKNPGTSIITARVNNQSFQCNVTVPVPVMNKETALLFVGDTLKLKLKKTGKDITWKSDNDEIAMVSSKGKVVARSEGTAIITATANKKSYACEITVVDISAQDDSYDDSDSYDDKWGENEDISEDIEGADSKDNWNYEDDNGYQEDEADGFSEEEADGLREDEADGLREDETDGFSEEEADGLREDEADGLREDETDGFSEDEADGLREDETDGFSEDEADGFCEDEAERGDGTDRNVEEENKNEYLENPAMEKLKEYIRRVGSEKDGELFVEQIVVLRKNKNNPATEYRTIITLDNEGVLTFIRTVKGTETESVSVYMCISSPAEKYVVVTVCDSGGSGITSYMRMDEYKKGFKVFPYKKWANDAVQKAFESWDAFVRAKDIDGMNALGFSSY